MKHNSNLPLSSIRPEATSLFSYFPNLKKKQPEPDPQPNEHFKQSKIITQNTNCTSNLLDNRSQEDEYNQDSGKAISFLPAQKIKEAIYKMPEMEESQTRLIAPKKMKILPTDQEVTVKARQMVMSGISNEIKKQVAVQLEQTQKKRKQARASRKVNHVQVEFKDDSFSLKIPPNKKVQQILEKQPLRKRFSALLRDQQRYEIGYQHKRLLQLLRTIDVTIQFATMNKQLKILFFQDLRKNVYSDRCTELTKKHLQQLLFIDDQLFKVEWQKNDKIKTFDLLITLPTINSEDERVQKTRKLIVQYLLALEIQFLADQKKEKIKLDSWAEGFNPNNIEIPTKSLPAHPLIKSAQIRSMPLSKLQTIKNFKLKELFVAKKQEQDAKSLVSEEVANMIFFKKSNASIKDKLLETIKEKQAKLLENSKAAASDIDNQMLTEICDQLFITYLGKGVTNISKASLIELISKRLTYKIPAISQSIEIMIAAKNISFLKEIRTSSGILVLQIDRSKFHPMMDYLKAFKAG